MLFVLEIRGEMVNDFVVTQMCSMYTPLDFRMCFNVVSVPEKEQRVLSPSSQKNEDL